MNEPAAAEKIGESIVKSAEAKIVSIPGTNRPGEVRPNTKNPLMSIPGREPGPVPLSIPGGEPDPVQVRKGMIE